MSDLSSYLAQNYLVADPKPTKKSKKRKNKDDTSGLLITEDDDHYWAKTNKQNDDDEAEIMGVLSGTSSQFRKAKKSNWKNLTKPLQTTDAADAILTSVAAENAANQQYDDELPAVDAATSNPSVAMMADGTYAGLQSAAAISAQLKKRQREEREEFERIHKGAKEAETIYRDATGRRIDISMRREAARKAACEREEKEAEAKKALKGEVQIQQERRRREELEDAALMKFSRNADDEDLNRELKEKQRWNDPMAQFLIPKTSSGESAGHRGGKIEPVYTGSAPPNRYGINPGYRWDGVDRGNGFEAKRFKAINQKERSKNMEYSWQMDT